MTKYIFFIAILISLLIRLSFILSGKHVGDIYLLYNMGVSLFNGLNPYLKLDFYSYPPLAIYIQTLSVYLSSILHIPFMMVSKFFPNLADFLTAIIIYKFLTRSGTKLVVAACWSGLFLLNPLSIIISSAHGQLDSITNFFVILSIYLLQDKKKYYYLSALALGLSISIKPNPVILLPFFLINLQGDLKIKLRYLALVSLPFILTLLPFATQNVFDILLKILGYTGVNDMSFSAVLRGIWYDSTGSINLPLTKEFIDVGKINFLSFYLFLFLYFSKKQLIRACLSVYLGYLIFNFAVSVQHLIWVIPLAILIKDRMLIFYLIFATLAALGFYLFFGQNILLGNLSNLEPFKKYIYPQESFAHLYVIGNFLFWVFNIIWLLKIIKSEGREFSKFGRLRKNLIFLSLGFFALTFIPIFQLLKSFFNLI